MTPFDTQCDILAEVWLNYRDEESLETMFEYFDLGFPLAYAYTEGIIKLEPSAHVLVQDCWKAIHQALGHAEDTGFESLSDLGDIGA